MNILLSAYTGLGNFVLKSPLLAHLARYPQVRLHLITDPHNGIPDLAAHHPHIHRLHLLPARATWQQRYHFARQHLAPHQYEWLLLPFDAQPNWLWATAVAARIRWVARHNMPHASLTPAQYAAQRACRMLLPDTVFALPPSRHETALNLDLLQALTGIDPPHVPPPTEVYYTPAADAALNPYQLAPQQYLVVQLGAANGVFAVKAWHTERFVQLLEWLYHHYPHYKIVLVGDGGDRAALPAQLLQRLNALPTVVDTMGYTSLNQLINLLAQARLVLCHDSGVMHLADALSVPLLALYGPTDYHRTRPLRATSAVLQSVTPYQHIMHHFAATEADLAQQGIGRAAMEGISVEAVMQHLIFNI